MYIKFAFKSVVLIVLLAIPLIFGAASNGYAGGPQPSPKDVGGPVLIGKAVDGLLTAVVVDPDGVLDEFEVLTGLDPFIVEYILVTCKEAQVVLGPAINFPTSPENFAQVTAECPGESQDELCLEGVIFGGAADDLPQSACFPEANATYNDLVITRVKNFINTGTAISAEVTLQAGWQQ